MTAAPIRRVAVEAPATSANLGAGYDALGLALDLVNRVDLEISDEPGVRIAVEGEGAGELEAAEQNRFVHALERCSAAWGARPRGLSVRMRNAIPLGRGLGSSAAATVAGLLAAAALAGRAPNRDEMLSLAVELEGHPDNAAAALEGGLVAITAVDGAWETVRFDPPMVAVVVFVPELRLATAEMRRVLPDAVPHADAAFNVGRVAVGLTRLARGDSSGFRSLTADRLHERYRAAAYPALPALLEAARAAGALGACLSGSGSSVIAFVDPADATTADGVARAFERAADARGLPGRTVRTTVRAEGATVVEAE